MPRPPPPIYHPSPPVDKTLPSTSNLFRVSAHPPCVAVLFECKDWPMPCCIWVHNKTKHPTHHCMRSTSHAGPSAAISSTQPPEGGVVCVVIVIVLTAAVGDWPGVTVCLCRAIPVIAYAKHANAIARCYMYSIGAIERGSVCVSFAYIFIYAQSVLLIDSPPYTRYTTITSECA